MGRAIALDANGVEYQLQWGEGVVDFVRSPKEGKKNGQAAFAVEGLQYPVQGWYDPESSAGRVLLSAPRDAAVVFRVETHRDKSVDGAIPYSQLPRDSENRRQVWHRITDVAFLNTPEADTIMEQAESDAMSGPRTSAPSTRPTVPSAPAAGADSWAFSAALGFVTLAFEKLSDARDNGLVEELHPSDVQDIARRLVSVADSVQFMLTGAVNRDAHSHTRARATVRTALKFWPIPIGNDDPAAWDMWEQNVARCANLLATVADRLHKEYGA